MREADQKHIDLGCTMFLMEFLGRDTREPAACSMRSAAALQKGAAPHPTALTSRGSDLVAGEEHRTCPWRFRMKAAVYYENAGDFGVRYEELPDPQ